MDMPTPDLATLARRVEIVAALRTLVAADSVIDDPVALRVFDSR